MSILISPSILAADFSNLLYDIKKVENAGADFLHIDIMDGHFVPNLSFGFPIIKSIYGKTRLPLDIHLMVDNPEIYIDKLAQFHPHYLTVHVEAYPHIDRLLNKIKEYGIKACVALNPSTSLSTLNYIKDLCDMILIMTVNPGFGGQKLIPYTLKKISDLKVIREKSDNKFLIEVDGGINIENVKHVIESGADVIVAGTCIFGSNDIKKTIKIMRGD